MTRIVLGFDLRIDPTVVPEGCPPTPLSQLLVPELYCGYSADPSVWRRAESVERLSHEDRTGIWNPLTLCKSAEAMLQACDDAGVVTTDMVRIALTSFTSNAIALVERYGPGWFENRPTEEILIEEGWELAGFDLIDLRGLISGLSGCGYRSASLPKLRNLFGKCMNEKGLFGSYSAAAQFGEAQGLQIPEHAPFVVMGIMIYRPLLLEA